MVSPSNHAGSAGFAFDRREIRGEIEFRDLTFAYGDAPPVLEHVSAVSASKRAIVFSISRTLPGHGWTLKASTSAGSTVTGSIP